MNENCKSTLKMFRMRAGLNQDDAANRLNISGHTLYNYETYSIESRKNMPPEEAVLKMMDLYFDDRDPLRKQMKQMFMGILYLYETNQIFRRIFSSVELLEMPAAFIKYQMELEDVHVMEAGMRRVIIDNRIDDHEIELSGAFLKELFESTFANIGLAISALEKTPQHMAKPVKKRQIERRIIQNNGEKIFSAWR